MTAKRHDDTREHLLAAGETAMLGKGFAAVGLNEILGEAGVPKGSFYHYFGSKEAFGVALLERLFSHYALVLGQLERNDQLDGRGKVEAFFAGWLPCAASADTEQRCLVVKLAGEVSDLSAAMRTTLDAGMEYIINRLQVIVAGGQADGSIAMMLPAPQLARALYQLWFGAAVANKVKRDPVVYDSAVAAMQLLLGEALRQRPSSARHQDS